MFEAHYVIFLVNLQFKEVAHAYGVLSNPKKREIYDSYGDFGLKVRFNLCIFVCGPLRASDVRSIRRDFRFVCDTSVVEGEYNLHAHQDNEKLVCLVGRAASFLLYLLFRRLLLLLLLFLVGFEAAILFRNARARFF